MRKTSISQRWEADFVDDVKFYARHAGVSITQFTIDALKLLGALINEDLIRDMTNDQRIKYLKNSLSIMRQVETAKEIEDNSGNEAKMSKTERIRYFLMQYPNEEFSTIQIANKLKLNQATVRTYVKNISEDENFHLIEGRPNKILYINSRD